MVTKIIGCGSGVRLLDSFGVRVIDKLKECNLPDGVELEKVGPDGFSLLNSLHGVEKVIIIDAVIGGDNPGTLNIYTEKDLPNSKFPKFSIHHLDLSDVLRIGRKTLGEEMPEKVFIVGFETNNLNSPETELSSIIEKSTRRAVKTLLGLIEG